MVTGNIEHAKQLIDEIPNDSGEHRMLTHGEIMNDGDEFLEGDKWVRIPIDGGDAIWQRWFIGKPWNQNLLVPFRRKLKDGENDE